MDFTFDEEQTAIAEAADGIFAGLVTPERVQEVEASEDRVDRRAVGPAGPGRPSRPGRPRGSTAGAATGWSSWPWCSKPRAVGRPGTAVGDGRAREPCPWPSSAPNRLKEEVLPGWGPVTPCSPPP